MMAVIMVVFAGLYPISVCVPATNDGTHTTADAATVYDWNMFRHDAGRSGVSPGPAPATNNVIWMKNIGFGVQSSPVVAGNIVCFGTDDGDLMIYDAASGSELWTYHTGFPISSTPAVDGNTVYFADQNGTVYAVNTETKKIVWSFSGAGMIYSSPCITDNQLFIGSMSGHMYALDKTTGLLSWDFDSKGPVYASPAYSDGKVYFGNYNSDIYCLDAITKTVRWNRTLSDIAGTPAARGERVFICADNGDVYALDANNGTIIWQNSTGGIGSSAPAVTDSLVIVGSTDDKVYAFNASTGALIWTAVTGTSGEVDSAPAVAGGTAFIGSSDGKLHALNVSNGKNVWNYTTGNLNSPAIAGGKLFVTTKEGRIYCFGPGNPALFVKIDASNVMPAESSQEITVTVTSSSTGLPIENAFVAIQSSGGGAFTPSSTGYTGTDGRFTATFTAPETTGTLRINTAVGKSGYTNGSAFLDITILSIPTLDVNITAEPPVLESGGTATLTIRVSNQTSGAGISNALVELTATGGTLSAASGYTQPTGDFVATYTAIATSKNMNIYINATAKKPGYADGQASIILEIHPKLKATISSNTTVIVEKGTAAITVQVTDISELHTPISSANVTLQVDGGTVSPTIGVTDSEGMFTATFTAPNLGGLAVQIYHVSANVTKNGYIGDTDTIELTVVNKTTPVLLVEVDASPKTIPSNGSSVITVTVRNSVDLSYVNTATVSLLSDSGGNFTPVVPSGNGKYLSVYKAPNVGVTTIVKISATALATGFMGQGGGQTTITVTTDKFENLTVKVVPDVTAINSLESVGLNITVKSEKGTYVTGATMQIQTSPAGGMFDPVVENVVSPGKYTTRFYPPSGLSTETVFTIIVKASKTNCNDGIDSSTKITVTPVPNSKPVCWITDPKESIEISGLYYIRGTASDIDNNLASVQVQVVRNGESLTDSGWVTASGTINWFAQVNTTLLANGPYTIYARAYDGELYSDVVMVNITVKNDNGGDDDGGWFGIPGYDGLIVVVSLAIAVFIAGAMSSLHKKKRR